MKLTPVLGLLALACGGGANVAPESAPEAPAPEASVAPAAKPAPAASNERLMPEVRYYEIADT